MKILFHTLGCKSNQYETEVMFRSALKAGHSPCAPGDTPDVCVVNSCTVTAQSDRKTGQSLRRFRRQYPLALLVLAGCFPQAFPEEAAALDADIVLGTGENLETALDEFTQTGKRVFRVTPHKKGEKMAPGLSGSAGGRGVSGRTRATLKIQDGCDRFCSYCIIPKARGFVRSKPLVDIAREAEALEQAGYREIVLTGINLCAYGLGDGDWQVANGKTPTPASAETSPSERRGLADAVAAASSPVGIERVRLGSLEPDCLTDELLDRLVCEKKLCPHFHLSLQSGCDETLKRMNRHYTTTEYFALCERLRRFFPSVSVTTDIMTGFPGETEEEFLETAAFAKKCGFARVHVFMYSRREGTAAYDMPEQVKQTEKRRRAAVLTQIAKQTGEAFLQSRRGLPCRVIAETNGTGLTENYIRVTLPGSEAKPGDVVDAVLGETAIAVGVEG
ncbi:MAG: MiaB/RimO family radical SAM methylthiotransferase [Oscillospiraceae bacterium]|nr:MiaB/RimO family radical SAM methylthiotransferase [Oscillospiraceae bacterium]